MTIFEYTKNSMPKKLYIKLLYNYRVKKNS